MNYLLGIDLGTSGTKTVLFDTQGTPVASCTREYPMSQPHNGWAEQDPEDWWQAVIATVREVLSQSGASSGQIVGIGLSGQMHGLVMLDGQGDVLRPAILWCDGRTGRECEEIERRVGKQDLIRITANPALTGFTASKILWVRRHEPACYAVCRHILLPKDYIRYRLTGVFAGEYSDASGTNLLDVSGRQWSVEILRCLEIDPDLLPPLYESTQVTGQITPRAAGLTGLMVGTPVMGGAGDNAAAAVGTGVVAQGKAFTTIGTSGVIFAHTAQPHIDPAGRVHTFCAAVPQAWTTMSCTLAAGLSLQWMRNQFFQSYREVGDEVGTDPYVLMDRAAARIPIGADRLLFLPYLMGERSPLLDSDARGVFFGLSAIHTRAHMLRAVLEGVVYAQRQCLDILRGMGISMDGMLLCGGGANSPLWRQMLADVFRCPVRTVATREGPVLGAAILAGVGTGLWKDVESACGQLITLNDPEFPVESHSQAYEPFYHLYCQLYPALRESFHQLAAL